MESGGCSFYNKKQNLRRIRKEQRNMSDELYIGVDLGTSAVKLLLMRADGAVVRTVSETCPVSYPKNGWSEQNPEDWTDAVIRGVRRLLQPKEKKRVRALAAAGQMHGLVALDEKGQVLRPAILWNDGRSVRETEELNQQKELLLQETGNIAFPGFTAPKLLWMKKNEPELFGRIRRILLPKDYLNYRLTGNFSGDPSDASGTLLYDVKNRRWSEKMLDRCGAAAGWLPKVQESYEPVGTIRPEILLSMGFDEKQKIVIAAGAGDNAAAAVGCGVLSNGGASCNISLGTSGTVFLTGETYLQVPDGRLHSFAHADGGYHLMGCMLSAASCNQWWMDDILGTRDYAGEQSHISDEMLGTGDVFFLPYLMGERAPYNDPAVRGAFFGLSRDTSREQMTLAVLEGVAFGIRDSLEIARSLGMRPAASRVCGGGAKSLLWRRILASVCRLPLERVRAEEGPGMGGALLAQTADALDRGSSARDGAFLLAEHVRRTVGVSDLTEPEPELSARCEEKYKKLYPLASAFSRL